jgi:hypothetical protein
MVHVMKKLDQIELKTAAATKEGEQMTGNDEDEETSNTNYNPLRDLRPTHRIIPRSPIPPLSKVWSIKAT